MFNKIIINIFLVSIFGTFLFGQNNTQFEEVSEIISEIGVTNFLNPEDLSEISDVVALLKNNDNIFESNKALLANHIGSKDFIFTNINDWDGFLDNSENYFASNFSRVSYRASSYGTFIRFKNTKNSDFSMIGKVSFNASSHHGAYEEFFYVKQSSANRPQIIRVLPLQINDNNTVYMGIEIPPPPAHGSIGSGEIEVQNVPVVIDFDAYTNDNKKIYTYFPFEFRLGGNQEELKDAVRPLIAQDTSGKNEIIGLISISYAPFIREINIKKVELFGKETIDLIEGSLNQ